VLVVLCEQDEDGLLLMLLLMLLSSVFCGTLAVQ